MLGKRWGSRLVRAGVAKRAGIRWRRLLGTLVVLAVCLPVPMSSALEPVDATADADAEAQGSQLDQSGEAYLRMYASRASKAVMSDSCPVEASSWNSANIVENGISTYVGGNLYGGSGGLGSDGYPREATSAVELEGRTVIDGSAIGIIGNKPYGRALSLAGSAWGAGSTPDGVALAIGGDVKSKNNSFSLNGTNLTAQVGGSVGIVAETGGKWSMLNVSANTLKKGMGKQEALRGVNGVDYNGYASKIKELSATFSGTTPKEGIVYDNVYFAQSPKVSAAPKDSDFWIKGNDGPLSGAQAGHPSNGNGKWYNPKTGAWQRETKLDLSNEGMLTFTGDGDATHTLQVFTVDMGEVNKEVAKNNWTGVSMRFENIPEGASVLINVTGTDDGADLTVHAGWRLWWNGTQVAHQYFESESVQKQLVTAESSIMWNFGQQQGNLFVGNTDGWRTLAYNKAVPPQSEQGHGDVEASLPGSILAAYATDVTIAQSTNGRLLVGGNLWLEQRYDQLAYGVGLGMEHHNFTWKGVAETSCRVKDTGVLAWKKSGDGAALLSGSEWTVSGDGTTVTVVDNGDNDADARPGYLQFKDVKPGVTYTLKETKAPDGYQLDSAEYTAKAIANTIVWFNNGNGIVNMRYPGSVTWRKVDASNTSKVLGGSEWVITGTDRFDRIDDITVVDKTPENKDDNAAQWDDDDREGYFKVSGLKPGTYQLTETKAPQGYQKLDQPIEFTIRSDGSSTEISLDKTKNDRTAGAVEWRKVAANDDTSAALAGSEWKLVGPCDQDAGGGTDKACPADTPSVVVTDTSENNDYRDGVKGDFKVSGLAWGKYTLIETKAPSGYMVVEPRTFVLDSTNTAENFYNISDPIGAEISWTKTDVNGTELSGSEWTVTDDQHGSKITVVDNGENDIDDMPGVIRIQLEAPASGYEGVRRYTLEESKAPDGYKQDDGAWTIQCRYTGGPECKFTDPNDDQNLIPNLTIVNKQSPGSLVWRKVDGSKTGDDQDYDLAGTTWHLEPVGEVTGDSTGWSSCSKLGGCNITDNTGNNGENDSDPSSGRFKVENLKPGEYKLTETYSSLYLDSANPPTFYVTVRGGEETKVNDGNPIANYPAVTFSWRKVAAGTDTVLKGSEWTLTRQDRPNEVTVIRDGWTDGGASSCSDGSNTCGQNDLATGTDGAGLLTVRVMVDSSLTDSSSITWILQETKAPDGYRLDGTRYLVTLSRGDGGDSGPKWKITFTPQADDPSQSQQLCTVASGTDNNSTDVINSGAACKITNEPLPELPGTGGSGTVGLLITGMLLTALAGVGLSVLWSRRMRLR